METSFSTITCTDNSSYVLCSGGGLYVYGDDTGKVQIDEYSGGSCNNTVPGVVVGSDGASAYINLYAAACWAGA